MTILPIRVFYSYAEEDESLRKELEKHLSLLKRQGVITDWHFRMISGGREWKGEINYHINNSKLILLLVSPDFLSSDYCYDVEMKKAIQLHDSGAARVIPIILRPVDWNTAPFGKLQALPEDGKPITTWSNQDEALLNVAQGVRQVAKELQSEKVTDLESTTSKKKNHAEVSGHLQTNVYCSFCGAEAGEKSTCIGMRVYHEFKSYPGRVYCFLCGAKAGEKSTCIGMRVYHEFKWYSGDVYCFFCGAKAGEKSSCVGMRVYHEFRQFS